ncbi:MAG: hypothetical protein C0505_02100 [Leptothrix sp. (in: Bacteria)]|nr:hypothetical protein [Leptothrix sp. (in: b-proteobacteria)]
MKCGGEMRRGKATVAAGRKARFDAPAAPFAWAPDQVQVLDDGTLARCTGPVLDATGHAIARFSAVWRQQAPGAWRVVFGPGAAGRRRAAVGDLIRSPLAAG